MQKFCIFAFKKIGEKMPTLFHQLAFIGVALYTTAMQLIKMNGLNKITAPQTKS